MRDWTYGLGLAVVGALALASISPQRANAYYNCHTGSVRSAHGNGESVTSSGFVNLTGASVSISTLSSCVRIDFSAQICAMPPKGLRVRVVVAGKGITGFPEAADFYTSADRLDGRAVSFTLTNMPAGTNVLRIQLLTLDGTPVTVGKWTMSVHHQGNYG